MALNFLKDIAYHKRITNPDLVHHLMGNGRLQAVAQVTKNPAACNALVLHLMDPERFAGRHKSDSFTFHQQLGPEYTLVGLYTDGNFYTPNPRQTACDLRYELTFDDGQPLFQASYPLDFTIEGQRNKTPFNVEETWLCPNSGRSLLRRMSVTNRRGLEPAEATIFAFLVPNQAIFPEAHFVTGSQTAVAGYFEGGDEFLSLAAIDPVSEYAVAMFPDPFSAVSSGNLQGVTSSDDDNFVKPEQAYTNYPLLPISPHIGPVLALQFDLDILEPEESRQIDLIYSYGQDEKEVLAEIEAVRTVGFDTLLSRSRSYWRACNQLSLQGDGMDRLYRAAQAGLRASVTENGRMNAGIWGYGAEWVRDSSLACVGAILSGQFALAQTMLAHILDDMVNDEGLAFGEGQFYEIQRAELDQNGELLHALWLYWVHSRDDTLLRSHWPKIQALAEFPLRPEFWVEEANMLRGERDVRERDFERHGLLPGFELAHQMWVSIGLERAADMAEHLNAVELSSRWRDYGRRIWDAVLNHPKFRLVENGYLMKRRTLQGDFQRTTTMKPYVHRPTEEPLTKMYPRCLNRAGALEPDAFEAWPIAHGLVDPNSHLARRTLLRMEQLWNQEWDFGGYPLHNVDSEPTKLGSWPMTFYIITQAAIEAGDDEIVRRNLEWIMNRLDGQGYMWWEYQDADPALQIDHGVIPWLIYGEPLALLVHHVLGYRPHPNGILIRPRLLPEWCQVSARLRNGGYWLAVEIMNNGRTPTRAEVNGRPWPHISSAGVRLDIPSEDLEIRVWLE